MLRVLLAGAAGSGKGTIGRMLVKEFDGFTYFSSGDLIRDHVNRGTEFGLRAKPFLNKGEHVPDGILNGMILGAVLQAGDKVILDGFPRSLFQLNMVEEKAPIDLCVEIKVPKKVLIERMSKQLVHPASGREYNIDFNPPKVPGKDDVTGEPLFKRSDDAAEVVRRRFEVHEKTESKVIDHYKKTGHCLTVSGDSSQLVFQQVSESMRDLLTKRRGAQR